MKKIILLFIGLFVWTLGVQAADEPKGVEVPAPQNVYARNVVSLNGPWHYFVDVQDIGIYSGYQRNAKPQRPTDLIEYGFDESPVMNIPCDWNTADAQLLFYEGTLWLCREFDYHPTAGTRQLLYFGAVNYETVVFANGREAGRHIGGFTPFCFDVTELLHEGTNFVVVRVNNMRQPNNVPTSHFDWWNYGGITRDVLLLTVPVTYVEDYSLQLKKQETKGKKEITFSVRLNRKQAGEQVTLSIPELKVKQTVTTDTAGVATATMKVKNLQLWSPEQPKLYAVSVTHGSEQLSDEVGFRTIETHGKQLLLNGEPIFLRGACMHEETAYTNRRITTAAEADTLLRWAKDMGCNFLRLAHYPHNERTVREAERQGILLWSEIPVYWNISFGNENTYRNAERQLHDMILRDHNRANVIIWSLANETPRNGTRDRFLGRLAQYARQLDPTRLISMAMEVRSAQNNVNRLEDNMHEYVDVVSFNEYIGWYRDVNAAPRMTWEIPYDKPVIISEFGGGAVAGMHGDKSQRWTEEFQENLYRENLAMLDKIDGLAGTCPWVLKDFRSPRRPLPHVQDYFNRKGLVSDQGKRKKAFYVMKEWYKNK